MDRADVVIVGGGVIGCSAAWHLRQDGFTGRLVVIERDPAYQRASSYLAMGGIRQQFCTPVTVQMVQFSVELWKQFDQTLGTPRSSRCAKCCSAARCRTRGRIASRC